jgi:hypothetical protein
MPGRARGLRVVGDPEVAMLAAGMPTSLRASTPSILNEREAGG